MQLFLRRALALAVAAAALFGAWMLYRGDFLPIDTAAQQTAAIRSYCSADETGVSLQAVLHPQVVFDKTIDGRRVLAFTDREIPGLLGHVEFRRGILGGWQALSAGYSAGPVLDTFALRDRNIRIVWAADCPPEIARYRVQANPDLPETLLAEGTAEAPAFFHIHETTRDFFPDLHLYTADGTKLNTADYQAIDQQVPSPGIGSAEINLVYWLCALILAAGLLPARALWRAAPSQPPAPETEP